MKLDRREFVAGLLAAAFAPPALAYVPPSRTRGSKVISVKDYGAKGDGIHDDTTAINNAIAALPSTGGTVYIPPGIYQIDASRHINLRSNMLFKMDPLAILQAKTNSLSRYYILYANGKSNVEIAGGQLIGERKTHIFDSSSTDEWGMGIQILGCTGVTIRDLRVADCTGDGVEIGGGSYDVVIDNIVSTNNRRQGLSITRASKVRVYDSEFSYTNGTSPECGIDIEPDLPAYAKDIIIDNCDIHHNAKYGINVYKQAQQVEIRNGRVHDNRSCGIVTYGCSNVNIHNIRVDNNRATGIALNGGTGLTVKSVTFYNNYNRLGTLNRIPDVTFTGYSTKYQRDLLRKVTATIGTNYYT